MGKSQKIQDAAAKDKEFENFLLQRQEESGPKIKAYEGKFEKEVAAFYENTTSEYITIAEGEKWDYHLSSELGLGALKQRVTELVYGIFGVEAQGRTGKQEIDKTDNGSVVMELSENVLSVIKLVNVYKMMAAAAAANFIFQVMNMFSTKLDISESHNYNAQTLTPGLTLHLDLYNFNYSNTKFLKSDQIVMSYMRFQLIYSYSLAQTITDQDCILKLQESIAYQAESLLALKKELVNMIVQMTPETQAEVMFAQMRYKMLQEMYQEDQKEFSDIVAAHARKAGSDAAQPMLKRAQALPAQDEQKKLEQMRTQMLSEVLCV